MHQDYHQYPETSQPLTYTRALAEQCRRCQLAVRPGKPTTLPPASLAGADMSSAGACADVPDTNVPGNESSMERTVQGTNIPRNEWSRERKFHHGNECSRERIVLGTNIFLIPYGQPYFGVSDLIPNGRIAEVDSSGRTRDHNLKQRTPENISFHLVS